jgi:hypothetical protein
MAIYLDDYRKARALKLPTSRSDEEFQYVDRTPMSDVVTPSSFKAPPEPSPQLSDNFEAIDVRIHMERVRALASQI